MNTILRAAMWSLLIVGLCVMGTEKGETAAAAMWIVASICFFLSVET